jgi:hypothetical protein
MADEGQQGLETSLIAVQPVAGARAQLLHAFDSADPCRQFEALKGQDDHPL